MSKITAAQIAAMTKSTADTMAMQEAANTEQNLLAANSARLQIEGAARAEALQTVRDLVKDAKDAVKDQGDAGHKP